MNHGHSPARHEAADLEPGRSGHGAAKTPEQQVALLARAGSFGRQLPLAMATSRSFKGTPAAVLADSGAEQVPDTVGEGQAECPADDYPQDGAADVAAA